MFSSILICSCAFLLFMIWSYSILSYAAYNLYLNSFSTHSFFNLFHSVYSSFLIIFYVYSIFVSNPIGIWSLNTSWSLIVWWFHISMLAVDKVQSIRLKVIYSLFFLIHVNSSLLLFMLRPYILFKFSNYLPPISDYPSWHQLLICELKSPNSMSSLFWFLPCIIIYEIPS